MRRARQSLHRNRGFCCHSCARTAKSEILAKTLFTDSNLPGTAPGYDVAADGERFVMVEQVDADNDQPLSIHVVENWYEEFRERDGK